MKLHDLPMLADENIDVEVVDFLRSRGIDVLGSKSAVGEGAKDAEVLAFAFAHHRLVITHDRDFGALVFATKRPFFGILYLRPGHLNRAFTIDSLRTLLARDIDVTPPFVIVCERSGTDIAVRIRQPLG